MQSVTRDGSVFSREWFFLQNMHALRGCSHEKTRTGASFILGGFFDVVSRLHFISRYLKVYFMLIKCTRGSKSRYPFQSTDRPISHRNGWSFRVYMIPLRDFVPEWNSRPVTRTGVNLRRGDSHWHNILWWYHINKYRAMRGNRSETRSGANVTLVSCKHPLRIG